MSLYDHMVDIKKAVDDFLYQHHYRVSAYPPECFIEFWDGDWKQVGGFYMSYEEAYSKAFSLIEELKCQN